MPQSAPRFRVSVCSLALVSSLLVLTAASPGQAQEAEDYTISGNDGYGIADCMKAGTECGRVIADSWCESHGHAHVISYGLGEDVTGTTSTSTSTPVVRIAAGDIVIRCGD